MHYPFDLHDLRARLDAEHEKLTALSDALRIVHDLINDATYMESKNRALEELAEIGQWTATAIIDCAVPDAQQAAKQSELPTRTTAELVEFYCPNVVDAEAFAAKMRERLARERGALTKPYMDANNNYVA